MSHNTTHPSLQPKLRIDEQKISHPAEPFVDSKNLLEGEDDSTWYFKEFELQPPPARDTAQNNTTNVETREHEPFFVLDHHQRRPLVSWTKLASKHQRPYNMPSENMYTRRERDEMRLRFYCKAWSNGVRLRVRFLNGTGHQRCAAMSILRSQDGWTRSANIEFILAKDDVVNRKPTQAEVRIQFVQKTTSVADLGFEAVYAHPIEPTVLLNELTLIYDPSDLLHEAGHVLGVHHEHQRCIPDTDMDPQAICRHLSTTPQEQIYSEILHRVEETRIDPFEYEPRSIMHYRLHSLPAEVFRDNKAIRNVDPSEPSVGRVLATKDHKLIAYLYPLPAGGYTTPKHIRPPGNTSMSANRQAIMLPHVWSSTPRVMLGIRHLRWNSHISSASVNLWATSRSHRHFHLEAFGVNTFPEIAWLAIDPLIGDIQMSCFKSSRGNTYLDPWGCYSVETHELKPNISSKATVVLWLEEIGHFDTTKDFFVNLDAKLRLRKHHKELNLYYGASDSIGLRAKWMVINPSALNIDGGQVVCKEGEPRNGAIWFKENLGFEHWGPKSPQILTGIHGLKYRAASGHGPHEVWFKIGISNLNTSGFTWQLRVCHEECFQELRFSWVLVPKSQTTYFGVPKGADRPRCSLSTTRTRTTRLAEGIDKSMKVLEDLYEGLPGLFA